MESIQKSIEVNAPLSAVYNQWTQFEEFPHFMEGVKEVKQLDDKRLHWKTSVAGREKEWDAEIYEQTPDRIIAWRSTSGTKTSGRVEFTPVAVDRTRITLTFKYEVEGALESAGDALGLVSNRVGGDLERFKDFMESRGTETGAWRGEIHGREVKP
jgi:uncharacterized membrane protein